MVDLEESGDRNGIKPVCLTGVRCGYEATDLGLGTRTSLGNRSPCDMHKHKHEFVTSNKPSIKVEYGDSGGKSGVKGNVS